MATAVSSGTVLACIKSRWPADIQKAQAGRQERFREYNPTFPLLTEWGSEAWR